MMRLIAALAFALLLSACGGGDSGSSTPGATSTKSAEATPGVSSTAEAGMTPQPTATTPPVAATATPFAQGTGVSGVALVGPSCPVAREDEPCPDKPWPGVVVARTLSGVEAGRATTNAEGRFVIQVPPGTYNVVTLTSGIFPAPASVQARVIAGQMTQVELLLDSGIR
jgi:hypothetical protein